MAKILVADDPGLMPHATLVSLFRAWSLVCRMVKWVLGSPGMNLGLPVVSLYQDFTGLTGDRR
jgi:hypothetical protein